MRVLIAAIACWGIGCAGAASNTSTNDFRDSDLLLFDNAVDLVRAPVIVEGEYSGAFERRVQRADLIAVLRVDALSSDLVKRRSTYRLTVRVKNRIKGESSDEFVLRVRDDEPGYQSVRVNEDRLLHNAFVAFIKWESDPGAADRVAHWHFSPDSDAVRDKVEYLIRRPAVDANAEVEAAER